MLIVTSECVNDEVGNLCFRVGVFKSFHNIYKFQINIGSFIVLLEV